MCATKFCRLARFALGQLLLLMVVERSPGQPPNATPPQLSASTTRTIFNLPDSGKPKNRIGLRLRADFAGDVDYISYGYRKIDVFASTSKPVQADTEIVVVFRLQYYGSNTLTIKSLGVIPAGGSRVLIEVRFPSLIDFYNIELETTIDSNVVRELSGWGGGGIRSNTLAASLRTLDVDVPATQSGVAVQDFRYLNNLSLVTEPGVLPTNWLDLTRYDIVGCEHRDLATIAKQTDQLRALRKWLMSGGSLWVTQVGDDFGGLAEINSLLALPRLGDGEPTTGVAEKSLGSEAWRFVNLETNRAESKADGAPLILSVPPDGGELPRTSTPARPERPPVYSDGWFAERPVGFGRVVAFARSVQEPPSRLSERHRATAVEDWVDRNWVMRHGLATDSANVNFSNWLVPGVGIAPVVEFQVLITLFALAIGPLNYWLLWRAKRLHLLVVTVPAGALALTAALLVYGVVSDGLRTKVRVRSVTLLDQTTGEATTHARLSYYASFAPADGLRFDDETAVYPVMPGYHERYAYGSRFAKLEMNWKNDQQHLARGWLRSRTPTQYFSQATSETDIGIAFAQAGDELTATNNLGQAIELLLVRGQNGNWHFAEAVGDRRITDMPPVDKVELVKRFRALMTENAPQYPATIEQSIGTWNRYTRRQDRQRYWQLNGEFDYAGVGMDDNLMSERIETWMGNQGSEPLDLAPGSYLAICSRSVVAELGLSGVLEKGSMHLIAGRWGKP